MEAQIAELLYQRLQSIATTTSEVCVDPRLVNPSLSSDGLDKRGRQGSLQAKDVPGGHERPGCQRVLADSMASLRALRFYSRRFNFVTDHGLSVKL
jgi:hypothetical protein